MRPVDSQLAALEAALAASWDHDTLAVYADELLSRGEPRGELIAIDLEIAARGSSADLASRRTSLLHGWLGAHVPTDPHRPWIGESLRFGFVDDLLVDERGGALTHDDVALALATPLAPYLRGVSIAGDTTAIALAMQQLATRVHPHLQRLSISSRGGDPLGPAVVDELLAACPRLQRLEVRGNDVVRDLAHPTLRALRITGHDAIRALANRSGAPWPVEDLDFAFDDGLASDARGVVPIERPRDAPASLLDPAKLPALRCLDLSRNEPEAMMRGYDALYDDEDDALEGAPLDLYGWLRDHPICTQLTMLRLPSLRSDRDRAALERILLDGTALAEVTIARGHYYRAAPLRHASARLELPAPWPWPRPGDVVGVALRIVTPRSNHEVEVDLAEAATTMEQIFETLPPPARTVWTQVWHVITALADDRLSFPAARLLHALEHVELDSWRELRMELRAYPLADDAMVTIERATIEPWT